MTQTPPSHASADLTRAVTQGVLHVRFRALERRRNPAGNGGGERHRGGESEDGVVHRDAPRGQFDGTERGEQGDAPVREQKSAGAAERREQEAFGQQLADDTIAAGAERRTNRNLAFASGTACEQQVCHVGARDQQHERHGAGEEQQRGAVFVRELVVQRDDARAPVRVPVRRFDRQLRGDGGQLRLGLRNRHARFEQRD
ncbi:MAG TPA: hypothetical protein VIW45_18390 [Vicinamibacterales bacterium]